MTSLLLGLALTVSPHTTAQYPPGVPLPIPTPLPPPVPVAFTLEQFGKVFQPIPGHHKVWIIHPKTCQPVEVCFTLPPGCPKVEISRRKIEFDYGKREIEVHFRHSGRVEVEYD
jgi:hypothetical protein